MSLQFLKSIVILSVISLTIVQALLPNARSLFYQSDLNTDVRINSNNPIDILDESDLRILSSSDVKILVSTLIKQSSIKNSLSSSIKTYLSDDDPMTIAEIVIDKMQNLNYNQRIQIQSTVQCLIEKGYITEETFVINTLKIGIVLSKLQAILKFSNEKYTSMARSKSYEVNEIIGWAS